MINFRKQYEDDSCGAMNYVEYLEGRLSSEMSKVKRLTENIKEAKMWLSDECANFSMQDIIDILNKKR